MFNLDQAIAAWRRQLAAEWIASAEVLDELESHLRDDIEEQVRAGADAATAFDSALCRIGPAGALRTEFTKAGESRVVWHRRFWRNFYYCSATIAVLADLSALVSFELSLPERVAGVCGVVVFAWYLFRLPFLSWWNRGDSRARFLSALKAVGIIGFLWTWCALFTAIQVVHIKIGIIPTMIMWSLCAAYVFTGLVCGLNNRYGRDGGADGWPPALYPATGPLPPGPTYARGLNIPIPPANAFTPLGGKALELAREEALRMGHDFLGTEHLLLGVLRMAEGKLAQVLQRCQIDNDAVRHEIEHLVSPLPAHCSISVPPLTPRARKALRLAGTQATKLKHPLISPEHLLLGLLIEGSGAAAIALKNLGVQLKLMRRELSMAGASTS